MSNLPKFIALEKLLTSISHGRVELDLQVRSGEIVGITAKGSKKLLYNSSEKDINTNQTALEFIVKRMSQQTEKKISGEVVFRVKNVEDKIKSIEVESSQIIK